MRSNSATSKGIRIPSKTYQVPIYDSSEQTASDDITNQGWDHALPDVVPDCDIRTAQEDRLRNEEHVRNNVIESQADESKRWPPDRDDLAEKLSRHHCEKASETDEPVRTDTAQEDHVPHWVHDFLFAEGESFRLVRLKVEDAAVPTVC